MPRSFSWSEAWSPWACVLELDVDPFQPVRRRVVLRAGENRVPILLEPQTK